MVGVGVTTPWRLSIQTPTVTSATPISTSTSTATATAAAANYSSALFFDAITSSRNIKREAYAYTYQQQRRHISNHRKGNNFYCNAASPVSAVTTESSSSGLLSLRLEEIKQRTQRWNWKGYSISYIVLHPSSADAQSTSYPPLLLVHGFGASIAHWRRNLLMLSQNQTVYAIDLLGFGDSDKPAGYAYTMEAWAELILDFLKEIIQQPTILIGNSVGSLACVIAASDSKELLVRGLVLLNCAGGMNNKAIVDDWRIKLLLPLLWLIDFLLKQRGIASAIFNRVKEGDNLKNILSSVYANKEAVDEELVQIIKGPAEAEGALDAFVSIVTGPPGPSPVQLMPRISVPVLILWGDEDPFTPIDGPVGKYFTSLPSGLANVTLFMLEGVGHCPHDDRPELVHEKLLPWLAALPPV